MLSFSRGNHVSCRRTPLALLAALFILSGCSTTPPAPLPQTSPAAAASVAKTAPSARPLPVLPPANSGRGGYYLDDGPGDNAPDDLHAMADAVPKVEPYSKRGNRPYVVFGKRYVPFTDDRPLVQRGMGSWYGKKFHGQKTSSGELYDMYKMSAAHPTLPIPSYARVTNVSNGVQVIVRVNDRGPFHSGRIIDLSYTAALKLGYLSKGSTELEVQRLLPDDIARITEAAPASAAVASASPSHVAVSAPVSTPAALTVSTPSAPPSAAARLAVEAMLRTDADPGAAPAATPLAGNPVDLSAPVKSGFYLQLGAYGQVGNAEAMREQLLPQWSAQLPPLEVAQHNDLYRLWCGPFASRDAAAAALGQLPGARPAVIVQR